MEYENYPNEQHTMDTISQNQPYNSFIQIRLDCERILSDIKDFLTATVTYDEFNEETGRSEKKVYQIGEPLANRIGIQNIMLRCRNIFNPQAVQGNYDDAKYNRDVKMLREELALELVLNRYKWDININNINSIIDKIMNFAKPFMSRTLYNKERESYNTMQSRETHTIQQGQEKKGFGF